MDERQTVLTTDRATTISFDPIGDDKVPVRTATWEQKVVVKADQAIEIVALGKSPRVVVVPRRLEYLNYDPSGLALCRVRPAEQ